MSLVCTEVLSHLSFGITADAIIWVVDMYGIYTSTESGENARTSSARVWFLVKRGVENIIHCMPWDEIHFIVK